MGKRKEKELYLMNFDEVLQTHGASVFRLSVGNAKKLMQIGKENNRWTSSARVSGLGSKTYDVTVHFKDSAFFEGKIGKKPNRTETKLQNEGNSSYSVKSMHKKAIQDAVKEGKTVSNEVLKLYPELKLEPKKVSMKRATKEDLDHLFPSRNKIKDQKIRPKKRVRKKPVTLIRRKDYAYVVGDTDVSLDIIKKLGGKRSLNIDVHKKKPVSGWVFPLESWHELYHIFYLGDKVKLNKPTCEPKKEILKDYPDSCLTPKEEIATPKEEIATQIKKTVEKAKKEKSLATEIKENQNLILKNLDKKIMAKATKKPRKKATAKPKAPKQTKAQIKAKMSAAGKKNYKGSKLEKINKLATELQEMSGTKQITVPRLSRKEATKRAAIKISTGL